MNRAHSPRIHRKKTSSSGLVAFAVIAFLFFTFAFRNGAADVSPVSKGGNEDSSSALIFALPQESEAQAADPRPLVGYAWSSNIGWISFDGTGYGVSIDDAGNFSGYAWSSNIGWITFNANQTAGCPNGSCSAKLVGNAVSGWARACSVFASGCSGALKAGNIIGGWDGWISLSGITKDGSRLRGYAWGNDVVGWIDMGWDIPSGQQPPLEPPTGCPACTGVIIGGPNQNPQGPSGGPRVTLTALPSPADYDTETTLSWTVVAGVKPVTRCTASNGWSGTKNRSGGEEQQTITDDEVFELECVDEGGNRGGDSVSVPVNAFSLSSSGNISVRPSSVPLGTTESSQSTIRVTEASSTFDRTVNLSGVVRNRNGEATGWAVRFSDTTLSSGEYEDGSRMSVLVPNGTGNGTYTVTVTGRSGGIERTIPITLTVGRGGGITPVIIER